MPAEIDLPVTPKAALPRNAVRSPGWLQTLSSLNNRNYLYLWLGMLAMMGSLQMQMFARSYLVYELERSATLLGFVNAGMAIPLLALALIGGAFADRLERKHVIQAGQGISALTAFLIAIAITTGTIAWYHLLAAAVVQGATFAFMMPARQAIIPELVGRDQINNAIALQATGMNLMTLTAPAIAGGLYKLAGPDTVYYTIAGLGFIAVFLTGLLPNSRRGPVKSEAAVVRDIKDGLSYIRRSPLVLILLAIGLTTTLLAMPIRFLLPVFVIEVYGHGPDAMGLLVAIMGAGALAGSLFIAGLGARKRGLLLIFGSFATGVGLLMLAMFPFYFAAAAIMILIGLGDSGRRTLNQALIMEAVEDRYRGRVMSVFMMNFGLMPLGVLPAAFVADLWGIRVAAAGLAILLLITTCVILGTQRRLREAQ